jgi:hypothetical protein
MPISSEQSATLADEQLTKLVYQRIRGALQTSAVES